MSRKILLGVRLLRPSAGGGERHHRGLETVVVRVARTSDERTGEGQGRAVVLDATVRSRGTARIPSVGASGRKAGNRRHGTILRRGGNV